METMLIMLLVLLVVCAVATALTKNLLAAVIIFMAYSVIMSIVWAVMKAPDLAITEAAVGAGISSVLFFLTLRKIHMIEQDIKDEQQKK